MLVIRLQRTGSTNTKTYRLVVAEKDDPIKGKVKEFVGHYLPEKDPHVFEFNQERISHWISVGATPSDTVARLLAQKGIEGMEKFTKRYAKQKRKKEVPEEQAAAGAPEAPAENPSTEEAPPAADAPAEQTTEEQTPETPPEEAKKEEPKEPEAAADTEEKKE